MRLAIRSLRWLGAAFGPAVLFLLVTRRSQ